MRVAVSIAAFAGLVFGFEDSKPAKLPREIQQVVDLAVAAPPEFAADALLRLVESGRVANKESQKQLVETAFGFGARAQHPIQLVAAPGSGADTRAAYRASALRLKLDAVSLQARALGLMAGLDRGAARAMWARFARPSMEPVGCEAALVPDTTTLYDLAARLAQGVFDGGDGDKNSRLGFVTTVVDRMASHAEAAGVARLVSGIAWTASQFEIVSGAFVSRLQALAADDRSFSLAAPEIEQAVADLVAQARHYNSRAERISEGYRNYLVANLAAGRCAGNGWVRARIGGEGESIDLFGPAVRSELAPLSAEELRWRKTAGEAKAERYWESAESKQVFEECLKLRQGPDGQTLAEAARQTREWRRQLGDFLNRIAEWKPTQEKSEEDYYHQRAIVYEALLELTPGGDVRDRVLDEYVTFLKTSNVQQRNPVEWYWHASATLKRIRTSRPMEAQRLLAAYESSGNLVLMLEAILERLVPGNSMFGN